jgi:ABC-type multidrug transport system permease subunit
MMLRTAWRAAMDQMRMRALSPLALLSGVALPCLVAFVVQTYRGGHTDAELAVGIAGIGVLDALVVLITLGMLAEKSWKTLQPALSSPGGIAPLVLGRLLGMGMQSLLSIPGTIIFLVVFYGVEPGFDWVRWFVGTVVLAGATTCVMGLLGCVVLRFPFSPGMTNGIVGLVLSLSALITPVSALPSALQSLAWVLPQSQVMAWVRGEGPVHLVLAWALSIIAVAAIVMAVWRLERAARRDALPLEA